MSAEFKPSDAKCPICGGPIEHAEKQGIYADQYRCAKCGTIPACRVNISEFEASDQLRKQIHDVIRRYGQESDITVYQVMGVLEMVKLDMVDMLERKHDQEDC